MRARKLFHYKASQGRVLVEMVIWALPRADADRPHGLKYRLYCGCGGDCLVRYDNERGKGDHRHYRDREEAYPFQSLEQLIADFRLDCTHLAGWRWDE
ncbi:hypothetical protein TspCOW1_21300 [Thiohalobacter sp. COW1]|uniref:toxin-antitoxin system TumE family protein n=1 Tax=Thiohalobacter sp. COW1 TaxID=2795687 RepID=UPI0019391642|nr:DUF6516 family protein [Thiohalobacter sp. COW1]BCO32027.1 hypothetical protein TspCOW1_21300 [Thiohalobacter sp. COW1]